MPARDQEFKRTFLEELTQPTRPDTVLQIPAFNYTLEFDPIGQNFFLNIDTPKGRRFVLPFERLNFGQFIKAMGDALEAVQNRINNENENGTVPE